MTQLLALDPGKSTGWTYGHYSDDQPLTILQGGAIPGGCEGFINWWQNNTIDTWHTVDVVVCELFEIDGTVTGSWSPRIEGALMAMWPGEIVWQRRDDKAALLPTEPARRAWFNRRGMRFKTSHELDAVTHALVFVGKRLHHDPTLRHWWPKDKSP